MSTRYKRIFNEAVYTAESPNETFDIELCDESLRIIQDLIHNFGSVASGEAAKQMFKLKDILTKLKNNETSEQRVQGVHPESGLEFDFKREPWMSKEIPE